MQTPSPSLGSALMDAACQDAATWKALSAKIHRTQLWSYRNGKSKPNADTMTVIALICPGVTADTWGQPPPKRQRKAKAAPVVVAPPAPVEAAS